MSAQISENFGGVVLWIWPGPAFYHFAICSDEDRNTGRSFLIGAFRRTVSKGNRAVGIAKEIGRQTGFGRPFSQVLRGAEGDAQQFGVFVFKLLGSITEPFGFFGSSTAKGAREKPDQHIFTSIICKAYVFSVLIG